MRCDDIQERFIDLLYGEGDQPADAELQEHVKECARCRNQLEELKKTQKILRGWQDEAPLKSVIVPRQHAHRFGPVAWRRVASIAVAAMALLGLMALANTKISWTSDGFSFSAGFFPRQERERDYYTKDELRELVKQALDDSESRMGEANYTMMQNMLDTVEQDRWMDLKLVSSRIGHNPNRN